MATVEQYQQRLQEDYDKTVVKTRSSQLAPLAD
jgi:hypothetical protein